MTLPLDPIKREAYLKAMSERVKGKARSDEVRARISETLKGRTSPMKGKHHTEETKQKCREGSLGRLHTEEAKQKISASQKGRTFSDETRQKMSDAKKGKPSSFKGKHLSESAKQKLRDANLGKKQSPETIEKRVSQMRGENHWNYGIGHSEETKEKISLSNTGKHEGEKNYFFGKHFCGKDHHNWNGGSHFFPYCEKFNNEFKERVRSYFGNICIECHSLPTNESLHIHHVNFDKMSCCNDELPLFVPLCRSCHAKTNYNREYWEQHFTEIINQYYGGKCYFTKEEMQAIQSCA